MRTDNYTIVKNNLQRDRAVWAITGVAGFIGSNLLEQLLKLDQTVIGVDNLSTGHERNLDEVRSQVSTEQWKRFRFIREDIRDLDICREVCAGADYLLHEAAMGSVPRSLDDPLLTNENNISATLNVFVAARDSNVKRVIYAASSSTYGDYPGLPKVEDRIGKPLSPYAVTKLVNELYADVFSRCYRLDMVGLRYFNVFGKRQDPEGEYAAVIPKWIAAMIQGQPVHINGTGETSRDFCYVDNVVQMNLLAATTANGNAANQVYNAAVGDRTTLNQLFEKLRTRLLPHCPHLRNVQPAYRDFREGDIMHSQADVTKAKEMLGYQPTHTIDQGLDEALPWYLGVCSE